MVARCWKGGLLAAAATLRTPQAGAPIRPVGSYAGGRVAILDRLQVVARLPGWDASLGSLEEGVPNLVVALCLPGSGSTLRTLWAGDTSRRR